MEIKIRNLGAATVCHIDELAHKKGISRNQLLCEWLDQIAMMEGLVQLESKYERMYSGVIEMMKETNLVLEATVKTNGLVLQKINETEKKG